MLEFRPRGSLEVGRGGFQSLKRLPVMQRLDFWTRHSPTPRPELP